MQNVFSLFKKKVFEPMAEEKKVNF